MGLYEQDAGLGVGREVFEDGLGAGTSDAVAAGAEVDHGVVVGELDHVGIEPECALALPRRGLGLAEEGIEFGELVVPVSEVGVEADGAEIAVAGALELAEPPAERSLADPEVCVEGVFEEEVCVDGVCGRVVAGVEVEREQVLGGGEEGTGAVPGLVPEAERSLRVARGVRLEPCIEGGDGVALGIAEREGDGIHGPFSVAGCGGGGVRRACCEPISVGTSWRWGRLRRAPLTLAP